MLHLLRRNALRTLLRLIATALLNRPNGIQRITAQKTYLTRPEFREDGAAKLSRSLLPHIHDFSEPSGRR